MPRASCCMPRPGGRDRETDGSQHWLMSPMVGGHNNTCSPDFQILLSAGWHSFHFLTEKELDN